MNGILHVTGILNQFLYSTNEVANIAQCYSIGKTPETLDWSVAYSADTSTKTILSGLKTHQPTQWSQSELASIEEPYHTAL